MAEITIVNRGHGRAAYALEDVRGEADPDDPHGACEEHVTLVKPHERLCCI